MITDVLNRGSIKETCVKTYQKGERTENVDADIFETNSETAASQEGPLCRNDNKQDNAIRDSVSARYCASFHDFCRSFTFGNDFSLFIHRIDFVQN
jgi:hypothetical protein